MTGTGLRRIGLLGGTFDPPHVGHLVVADQVLDQLGLDEVRLVVNNRPWQKVGRRVITAADRRYEMVATAVAGAPGLIASDIEMRLGGPSYTMVTIEALTETEPDVEWLVIVGADAAAGLDTWHRAEDLRATQRFVVVNRGGVNDGKIADSVPDGWRYEAVEIPALDVSSSELRELVAVGRSVRHLVPDAVVQLLDAWGLYRSDS